MSNKNVSEVIAQCKANGTGQFEVKRDIIQLSKKDGQPWFTPMRNPSHTGMGESLFQAYYRDEVFTNPSPEMLAEIESLRDSAPGEAKQPAAPDTGKK